MCSGAMRNRATARTGGTSSEHPAGNPAVGTHRTDLTPDSKSFANDRRELVEHLRQVAAGLALRQHGRDEDSRVEQRHAVRELLQNVGERLP